MLADGEDEFLVECRTDVDGIHRIQVLDPGAWIFMCILSDLTTLQTSCPWIPKNAKAGENNTRCLPHRTQMNFIDSCQELATSHHLLTWKPLMSSRFLIVEACSFKLVSCFSRVNSVCSINTRRLLRSECYDTMCQDYRSWYLPRGS